LTTCSMKGTGWPPCSTFTSFQVPSMPASADVAPSSYPRGASEPSRGTASRSVRRHMGSFSVEQVNCHHRTGLVSPQGTFRICQPCKLSSFSPQSGALSHTRKPVDVLHPEYLSARPTHPLTDLVCQ